jgi:multiple sugar transport system substrate-binding protein
MGLQTKQDTGTQLGFAFQGAEYEGGVCNGLEYIRTHGGEVLDTNDPSKVIIDSAESAAGLETWHSMIEDGVATRAVLQYKEDESYGAFIRGDAIFLRNWPYVYALLSNPEQSEITPDQVGVAPIPVSEGNQSYSTLGGWNFLIYAASDMQDDAWESVRWMTDPE